METNILRRIFFDKHQHWEAFKRKHGAKIRPIVIKEVEKFRDCGDIKNGFKLFVCEGCHDVRRFLTDVKVDFVPRALLEKVKNGVGYLLQKESKGNTWDYCWTPHFWFKGQLQSSRTYVSYNGWINRKRRMEAV